MSFQTVNNYNSAPFINPIGLGVGLNFNGTGVFKPNYLTFDQVIDNLKDVLLTRKGERLHNVNFGSDLMLVIFQPNTLELKQQITDIIIDAIDTSYDSIPINIENIEITTAEDDPSIDYNIIIKISISVDRSEEERIITISADDTGIVAV